MGATIYSLTGRANPHLLSERIRRQSWLYSTWAKFIGKGYLQSAGYPVDYVKTTFPGQKESFDVNITGAPVEEHKEFLKAGKNTLDIPVRMLSTGMPIYGDTTLKGTGEKQRVIYRTIRINVTRKAWSLPSLMSAQITLPWLEQELLKKEPLMIEWFNRMFPANFLYAMLAGSSVDLTSPTAIGGANLGIISHPNFIVAGSGKVGYGAGKPGTAAYEASVEAALAGLGASPEDYMSVALIENLPIEAARVRLGPLVMKSGYQFFPFIIKDTQWKQLQRDPEFRELYKKLDPTFEKSPLVTGAKAAIGSVVIYTDPWLFGARIHATDSNVTAGTVEYGPAPSTAQRAQGLKIGNWLENFDTSNLGIGVLMGQNALAVGQGVPVLSGKKQPLIAITEEVDDHGAVTEVGLATVQSVVRTDNYDQDAMVDGNTAGDFQENTGSLVVATYSPYALAYA